MTYSTAEIPVEGGTLHVGIWSGGRGGAVAAGGPLVVAAHGITSSHMGWALVGPELGRDHRFVAPDLRGRGASRDLPGPYGMQRHARDMAAVIAYFGGPAIVVGHSMGGFVAVATARAYPDLVSRLVLVDGGPPFPVPPAMRDAVDDAALSEAIAATVGPAYARLSMTFPTREAYREYWQAHPSLVDWNEAMAAYADYDLIGEPPEFRPACKLEAALRDARDLYAFAGVEPAALPVPAVLLRASHGMLGEPDKPLYRPGAAAHWLPGTTESTVDGANHYTITLGPVGAAAVAQAVRSPQEVWQTRQ
jgi:pimeloyl-ACP methyl ester carboxylesterase